MTIHPTAIIDSSAKIDPTVEIGPYVVIGPQVTIAADCQIASHVVIPGFTRIGQRNQIHSFAIIGDVSQDLKYKDETTWLEIGDENIIRESCTIHRGTAQDQSVTTVGSFNLFMVNSHIAHDCVVGNHNILANNVGVAGHVRIQDHIVVGGNSGVHQFCHIGSFSMVGGGSVILKDVMSYAMVSGNPATTHGLNYEGMKRRGYSKKTINGLREAYKVVFKQGLTVAEAIEKLNAEFVEEFPEIQFMVDSLKSSDRGIIR